MGILSNLLHLGNIPGSVAPTTSLTQLIGALKEEYKQTKNSKKKDKK